MSFVPSPYSGLNGTRINPSEELFDSMAPSTTGKADMWASAISAAGALATTGVTLGYQASATKKQQAHERKMAKQQEKLLGLQTQAASAQGGASRAAATLQALATTKTLLIVGGTVITFGLIAATITAIRRGDRVNGYSEDTYE